MKTDIQYALKYVFTQYHNGGKRGFSNIEQLKLIPSLMAYYGDSDITDAVRIGSNKLRGILVKIEFMERSSFRHQDIPSEFECAFKSYNRDEKTPDNFTFAPNVNISVQPVQVEDYKKLDEIEAELCEIDIFAILAYIKEKAVAAGDFEAAMEN